MCQKVTPTQRNESRAINPDNWAGKLLGITNQDIVRVRLREYARRKWNVKLEKTKDLQRLAAIKVMLNYNFTVEEIIKLLQKGKSTIYRDIEALKLYEEGHKEFLNIYDNILSFIRYYDLGN